MKTLTVTEVLDSWANAKIDDVSKNVTTSDIWCFARLVVMLAGKHAADTGNESYEQACADFVQATAGVLKDRCKSKNHNL